MQLVDRLRQLVEMVGGGEGTLALGVPPAGQGGSALKEMDVLLEGLRLGLEKNMYLLAGSARRYETVASMLSRATVRRGRGGCGGRRKEDASDLAGAVHV